MLKRGFQFFCLVAVASTALISCEECKECDFSENIYYSNIPSLSGISNQNFSKIAFFKEKNSDFTLGEVCGKNLDDFDDSKTIDTVYIYNYTDNLGQNKTVPGGITRLTTRTYICK